MVEHLVVQRVVHLASSKVLYLVACLDFLMAAYLVAEKV